MTNEAFRKDVDFRNLPIIWGVFSAIPAEFSKDEVYKYPLPESEIPYYMSSRIVPQHPLAVLELYVDDGSFTFVSAHDASLLQPLYRLPYKTCDMETDNKKMNAQLRYIQDILRKEVPDVSPAVANNVQWKVWHTLFKDRNQPVDDRKLYQSIMNAYHIQSQSGQVYKSTYWDPYIQE